MSKILIADDERENRYLLEQILRSGGHTVVSAENGREALSLARADRPDLIITDILMPKMDGFELCRQWKSDRKLAGVPYIFYSATYTDPKDVQFALSLGADRFIAKPQEPEELLRAVNELLKERSVTSRPALPRRRQNGVSERYSEVLFRKLEHKVAQLEAEVENRRHAEEEIAFRNAILNAQLETTIDAVMAVDEKGKILFTNGRFIEMWEVPYQAIESGSGELVLQTAESKLADPRPAVAAEKRLFENRERKSKDEITLADGRNIERYSAPILGAEGRYFGRIWYFRDITERKKTEKRLSLQAELLDAAIDAIFLFDTEGNVLYANKIAIEFRGYTREEMLRLNLRDLNDPENAAAVPDRLRMILKDGFALYESVHVKKDGTRFNVEILAKMIDIGGKKHILSSSRDITRRKRSLEALAESEERYRSLFEVSPDMIYTIAGNGTFVALNPAFEKLTGWEIKEWIGRPFMELIHPDDARDNADIFQRFLRGESQSTAELRIRTKSGRYLVGELSSARFLRGGKAAGVHGIARDITERKQTEAAIIESEQKFRSIFDNASEGILLVDLATARFIMCNPACAAMLGSSREELTGMGLSDIQSEKEMPAVKASMRDFLHGKSEIHRSIQMKRKDGTFFSADMSVAPAKINGKLSLIMIFTDVTERRRTDRELAMYREHLEDLVEERTEELSRANDKLIVEIDVRRKTEENLGKERTLLRTLVDSLPDEIYAKDRKGRFSLANVKMLRSFGVADANHLLGKTDFDFFSGDTAERLFREEQKIIKSGQPILERESETRAAGGEGRWLLTSMVPLRDDRGNITGLVGINRDITGLKLAEANLQKAKEQADAANNAKSAFLASLSHEIRTPMNAILGFSQLMLHEPGLTDRQKERLSTINTSGEHLMRLLNGVLELSKIETGHVSVNLAPFDLNNMIDEVEAMFRLKTDEKRLAFSVFRADDLPACVVSDELKIRQIIINLVGNAVKFTDEGSVIVRVLVEKSGPVPAMLLAEVEDTGRGIQKADEVRIFREFEQGRSGLSAGGTGLGLSLSRRLARLLDGDVTLEQKDGKGTLFRMRIPIRAGEKTDSAGASPERRVSGLKPGQRRPLILIVDDNAENRTFIAETLSAAGFATAEAANGREAVGVFRERRPDLVFMDINMEKMDGCETAEQIRLSDGKSSPIIAVTANAFSDIRERVTKAGIDGIIVKPFREDELFRVLKTFLGVEYEYESASAAPVTIRLEDARSAIARLPRELVAGMLEAARNFEMTKLLAGIERAEREAPEAARYMREAARRYQYDALTKLLDGAEEKND